MKTKLNDITASSDMGVDPGNFTGPTDEDDYPTVDLSKMNPGKTINPKSAKKTDKKLKVKVLSTDESHLRKLYSQIKENSEKYSCAVSDIEESKQGHYFIVALLDERLVGFSRTGLRKLIENSPRIEYKLFSTRKIKESHLTFLSPDELSLLEFSRRRIREMKNNG